MLQVVHSHATSDVARLHNSVDQDRLVGTARVPFATLIKRSQVPLRLLFITSSTALHTFHYHHHHSDVLFLTLTGLQLSLCYTPARLVPPPAVQFSCQLL